MRKKSPDGTSDNERIGHWMANLGGGPFIGDATLKSVKISKKGRKLTIVLKKKKTKRGASRI